VVDAVKEIQVPYGPYVLERGGAAGIVWSSPAPLVRVTPACLENVDPDQTVLYDLGRYIQCKVFPATGSAINFASARSYTMMRWDLPEPVHAALDKPVTILVQSNHPMRMSLRLRLGVLRESPAQCERCFRAFSGRGQYCPQCALKVE